jgi:hypothetical protein
MTGCDEGAGVAASDGGGGESAFRAAGNVIAANESVRTSLELVGAGINTVRNSSAV